ncbi:MAG: peptidylprolyl isomerase [Xanthomonadales bacterium]|nr:peptidylprolyl isomerase [Xanthomonadales bacterium]
MPRISISALLLAALFAVNPVLAATQALDRIVAIVDEDVILESELAAAIDGVRRQYQGREIQLPPEDVLSKQVLERLTLLRLQIQRAEAGGIQVTDTEIDQAVARVAASNSLTIAQLRQAVETDGFNFSEFRKSMREELLVQKLRTRVVESRVEISESEIERLLAGDTLKRGEVHLRHIMVQLPDAATPEQVATGAEKIAGIRQLIEDGKMEFSAAAIRYSDSPQALEGGDLGWRRFDQIPAAFADLVAGMEKGAVTQPVRTASGFHLLQVADVRKDSHIMVTEYHVRHIVTRVDDLNTHEDARVKIFEAKRRIDAGESFENVARAVSEDKNTANLGGDLGWIPIDAYGPFYAQPLSQMSVGGITEPLRSDQSWHMLQLVEVREADRTEDFLRQQATESLRERKAEEVYEQFLRQVRGEAYVETRLDPNGNSAG